MCEFVSNTYYFMKVVGEKPKKTFKIRNLLMNWSKLKVKLKKENIKSIFDGTKPGQKSI